MSAGQDSDSHAAHTSACLVVSDAILMRADVGGRPAPKEVLWRADKTARAKARQLRVGQNAGGESSNLVLFFLAVKTRTARIAAIVVTLTLLLSGIAHAFEPVGCLNVATAVAMGHAQGDGDQVPSDTLLGQSHHHGDCHAHHVLNAVVALGLALQHQLDALPGGRAFGSLLPAILDPALRPPIA